VGLDATLVGQACLSAKFIIYHILKMYLKTAIAMSVLAMGMAACSFTTSKDPGKIPDSTAVAPTPAEPTSVAFTVRYGLPLTTGRANCETETVNADHAKTTNVAELRPAIAEVLKAAKAGTINSYPKADGVASGDAKIFLKNALADIGKRNKITVKDDDVLLTAEVTYDGVATEGHSTLTPKSISFHWVDPKDELPELEVAHIMLSEIGDIKVKQGEIMVGLVAYLQGGAFERYVLEIVSPKGSEKVNAFTECKGMQEKIDKGAI
jgi:hypothetical protein